MKALMCGLLSQACCLCQGGVSDMVAGGGDVGGGGSRLRVVGRRVTARSRERQRGVKTGMLRDGHSPAVSCGAWSLLRGEGTRPNPAQPSPDVVRRGEERRGELLPWLLD